MWCINEEKIVNNKRDILLLVTENSAVLIPVLAYRWRYGDGDLKNCAVSGEKNKNLWRPSVQYFCVEFNVLLRST